MPHRLPQADLPPAVRRVLDAVKRRIRAYVVVEGIALVIAFLGTAFWLGLLVDWSFEPSPFVRQIAWLVLSISAGLLAYRYLLRRFAVPISDSAAAALLERRFPLLNEHVLTAVAVAASPDQGASLHPELVYETQQSAAHAVATVRPAELFNRAPLIRAISAASLLFGSIILFALLSHDTFAFWIQRIALSTEPWPRRVSLEVVGFRADSEGRRSQKLAQDDDFELLVHARTNGFQVPDQVEIRFRLTDGRRGRDTMTRVGDAQTTGDEFQLFRYHFKRVAADMEFDVVGGDDRISDLRLNVVDRPELLAIELECVYPDYLRRQPRRMPVTGSMRIPEGTRVTLHAASTKPLVSARIHRINDQQNAQLAFESGPQQLLDWQYGTLTDDDVLLVGVTDSDGVATREPYRISISVVRDEVPQLAVRLSGIGSAITPDAVLPVVGKITDDYGLERVWFEYQIDGGASSMRPIADALSGEPIFSRLGQFDLRAAEAATSKRELELKPGQRFTLTLKAADQFNLSEEPRSGSSQQFTLDVLTATDLLALMERRELALRQRYEAVYEKMSDTRNVLARVDFDETVEPAESASRGDGENSRHESSIQLPATAQRTLARRRLRVAGSQQNVLQSADEIAGIGKAFEDLGKQLTNNRIDNPDLISRLREQIALPLHRIAGQRMPDLTAQLKLLEQNIADASTAVPQLDKSLTLTDEILVEMRQVLDRMLELETYNEVVALLRDIITDQDEISRRTRERQRDRLRSLFEED